MKIKLSLILIVFFLSSCIKIKGDNNFSLYSNDIDLIKMIDNDHIFNGFGCSGSNISPQLSWKNPPKDAKSFAITIYDPDAPTGSGWWHWVVLNIPKHYTGLEKNFTTKNQFRFKNLITQVRNDYGLYRYGGPCPPKNDKDHRYIFTVYALKVDKIMIDKNATAAQAGYMINKNTIAKASFIAKYGR
jgi:Raf kinase inhibitor-like YbhB/YbcL family protein